jgi:hypothetical protein
MGRASSSCRASRVYRYDLAAGRERLVLGAEQMLPEIEAYLSSSAR